MRFPRSLSPRVTVLLALLSTVAFAPLSTVAGQGTAADSAHTRATKPALDSAYTSSTRMSGVIARICATKNPAAYVKAVCPDTATAPRNIRKVHALDSALVIAPKDSTPVVVVPTPVPVPSPSSAFTPHPYAAPANGAKLAELPRVMVDVSYPTITRRIRVTSLQAALDTAKTGDELLLTPGQVYPPITLKVTPRTGWVVVRTDVPEDGNLWRRMTPARADSLNLATIAMNSITSAVWVNSGAHHVRFTAVRMVTNYGPINAIFRAANGETSPSQLAHHITVDRSICDGQGYDIRRCFYADIAYFAVISSTLDNCHSLTQGDAQCFLSGNNSGPIRIQNNTIHGSHQGTMLGGYDAANDSLTPSDVYIADNLIERPLAWGTSWGEKTLEEQKTGRRVLYERNRVQHVRQAGQAGFAFLIKTENQNCTAPFTQSADVTIRYNVVIDAANGQNMGANVGKCAGQNATRITSYGNVFGPFNGTDAGTCFQYLGPLSDIVILHNTCQGAGSAVVVFDASANVPRAVLSGNVLQHGNYGVKGANAQEGTTSITKYLPGGLFESNIVYPAQCSLYPAGTLCALPSVLPLGSDGTAIGADATKVAQ
jgi:hypothetical protein